MKVPTLLPKVVVVIVNWNGRPFIDHCLKSLRAQTYENFQTYVVDNNSKDNSVEHIRKHYTDVEVIELKNNVGFSKANNIAIRNATFDYIATINNDVVAHPNWIENLVCVLENNSEAGFAACKMLFHDNPQVIDRAGDNYTIAGAGELRGRNAFAGKYNKMCWVFGACAGAALYRRLIFDEVGIFDESFFLLYEDVDLSFRAQLQGYRCCYVPGALAYHMVSKSIGNDSDISVYYGHRNMEWVFLKNMPTMLLIMTALPHLIYIIAAFLYFTVSGKGLIYIRAKIDALSGFATTLQKRRDIQARKKVSNLYLLRLMQKELLINRLKRRFKK